MVYSLEITEIRNGLFGNRVEPGFFSGFFFFFFFFFFCENPKKQFKPGLKFELNFNSRIHLNSNAIISLKTNVKYRTQWDPRFQTHIQLVFFFFNQNILPMFVFYIIHKNRIVNMSV